MIIPLRLRKTGKAWSILHVHQSTALTRHQFSAVVRTSSIALRRARLTASGRNKERCKRTEICPAPPQPSELLYSPHDTNMQQRSTHAHTHTRTGQHTHSSPHPIHPTARQQARCLLPPPALPGRGGGSPDCPLLQPEQSRSYSAALAGRASGSSPRAQTLAHANSSKSCT